MKSTLLKRLGLDNSTAELTNEQSNLICGGQSEDRLFPQVNHPFQFPSSRYSFLHRVKHSQYDKIINQENDKPEFINNF